MRLIKMLGLAAAAAMAAMALVGVGSASATVLCEITPTPNTSESKCPESHTLHAGAIIVGEAKNAELTSSLANVSCATSKTEIEVENTGSESETVTGSIIALNFLNCKTTGTNSPCTVEVENLPYHAEVHRTAGTHNGRLTVKSSGLGNPGAQVTCAGILECKFGNTLFDLPVTGGNPAGVTANETPLTIESLGLCPPSAKWDASYKAIGETTAIWVGTQEESGTL